MADIAESEHIDFDIGKEFYNFHNSYLAQKSKSKQINKIWLKNISTF